MPADAVGSTVNVKVEVEEPPDGGITGFEVKSMPEIPVGVEPTQLQDRVTAESKPFTEKDVKLRKRVFALYTRDRPTPFPWMFSKEPKFEIVK